MNYASSTPEVSARQGHTAPDITVVGGAGHVGIPLVLAFAEAGLTVNVNDLNEATLATLRAGKLPFIEYGAAPVLAKAPVVELDVTPPDAPSCGVSLACEVCAAVTVTVTVVGAGGVTVVVTVLFTVAVTVSVWLAVVVTVSVEPAVVVTVSTEPAVVVTVDPGAVVMTVSVTRVVVTSVAVTVVVTVGGSPGAAAQPAGAACAGTATPTIRTSADPAIIIIALAGRRRESPLISRGAAARRPDCFIECLAGVRGMIGEP